MKRVCVFCGANSGARDAYAEGAKSFGNLLAGRGISLVFGGGKIGLMGAVAEAMLQRGGEVIGVIPEMLVTREIAHQGLTELRIVGTMHERKATMAELADAFVALPGGYGTLEEFLEIVTWGQLGLHQKPCGLLNFQGYFDPLLHLIDHAVAEGFVRREHRTLILDDDHPERLLDRMSRYAPRKLPQWLHPEEI